MKHIRLAQTDDGSQITDLRVTEFSRARDFVLVDSHQLHWNEGDEKNHVVGVWGDNQKVVATIRMIRVHGSRETREVLEADIPKTLRFPGVVFNAAATGKNYSRQGFNQLIRYYGIQSAMKSGIRMMLSPVYENAPRINLMRRMGYVCNRFTRSWQTKLLPNNPRMLAVLEDRHFTKAVGVIEEMIPELIREYPWKGIPLKFIPNVA